MTEIYLTSTFTNEWNVEFNSKIGDALESKGITCYLPHRDTNQKGTDREKFDQNIEGIKNASILLAVGVNETPNWGLELGYAYGLQKSILVLTDKIRTLPLMCKNMVTELVQVENLDEISEYIDLLVKKIQQLNKIEEM